MKPILKYRNKNLYIRMDEYTINGRTYLALVDKEGVLWDDLTKNLNDIPVSENVIFLNPNIPKTIIKKLYDTGIIINLYDSQQFNMGHYDKAYVNKNVLDKYLKNTFYINVYESDLNLKNNYYSQDIKTFDDVEKAIQYSKEKFKDLNYYKVEVVDYKGKVYFDKELDIESYYINDLSVKFVPSELLKEYIDCWIDKKELPLDESLLYTKKEDKYVGVDNSTGDCWTEEFKNEKDVINWLLGVEKEDCQIDECKIMD